MAVDTVLCPHCLERASLPRKRNFFHMPTYVCPECALGFSYPFSWVTWGVCLLLALLAISILVTGIAYGTLWKAVAAGNYAALAFQGIFLAGSVGSLIVHARLRRNVAEAEARAAEAGVPAAGDAGSRVPSE